MNLHSQAVHVLLATTVTAAFAALLLIVVAMAHERSRRSTAPTGRPVRTSPGPRTQPPVDPLDPLDRPDRPDWRAVALAAVRAR